MIINIPTNNKQYFRQCLEILKVIPPLNNLSNRELDVLGGFLYYNHKYRDIKDSKLRNKLVFDYDTKMAIREEIGISGAVMDNLISSLKKKNILKGRNIINDFNINPENPQVTFKFIINEDN